MASFKNGKSVSDMISRIFLGKFIFENSYHVRGRVSVRVRVRVMTVLTKESSSKCHSLN